jgi:protein-disulfide isomerase
MAFTDFQCSQCKQLVEQVMPQIVEEYVDTGVARLQHRHSAAIGEESYRAAMASECAAEQGRFWEYHAGLFAMQGQPNSGAFSEEALRGLARSVGLDDGLFASCMDSGLTRAIVDTDVQAAAELGVSSVPALVINGAVVSGLQDYTAYQTGIGQAWIDIE